MKRSVRFGALIGLVFIVAVVIGVLVWPAPKEAKADELYLVHFYFDTPDNGVEGLDVWIWFSEGNEHRDGGPMIEIEDGWYWFEWDEFPIEVDNWECEFFDNEESGPWLPVNPDENPVTGLDLETVILEWQIVADPIR